MALKLYVNTISDDNRIGMATNKLMMLKNIELLKTVRKKNVCQSPFIFQAGRYVCCMIISSLNEPAMIFMDLQKNKQRALFAAKQYVRRNSQKKFMEVFEKVSEEYDENFNKVQLVLDINFVPDIVGN